MTEDFLVRSDNRHRSLCFYCSTLHATQLLANVGIRLAYWLTDTVVVIVETDIKKFQQAAATKMKFESSPHNVTSVEC